MNHLLTSALLLLALLLPATATAYDFEVDSIYYNKTDTTVTVTYGDKNVWNDNDNYTGEVIIPSTVTYNDTTYEVIAIGDLAFSHCVGLTHITLPNTITSIGEEAFLDCSGLTNITIPSSVTTIDRGTFAGCIGLTVVTIPASVTSIGDIAFGDCGGLTTLSVKNGNKKYDSRDDCNAIIETATNKLIVGCQNSVITDTITAIGDRAFYYCTGLTSAIIPDSVTSIGEAAFFGCSGLTSVTIGKSVNSIGKIAFSDCGSLSSITVAAENEKYDSRDDCNAIIETASNTLIVGGQNTIIPNSVDTIGDAAFYSCSGLMSITIPSPVKYIGKSAFEGCGGLTSATIANSVKHIGKAAFLDCYELTDVSIPNSIKTINAKLFAGCISLENVIIPNSVKTIGSDAFAGCSSLMSATIPSSVDSIGSYAFAYCDGLKEVFSHIANLSNVDSGDCIFVVWTEGGNFDYSGRTLHVPQGTAGAYQANENWHPYFGQIVDDLIRDALTGDVNGDGSVNIADINAVIDMILRGVYDAAGDVNGDDAVNITDINALINLILS